MTQLPARITGFSLFKQLLILCINFFLKKLLNSTRQSFSKYDAELPKSNAWLSIQFPHSTVSDLLNLVKSLHDSCSKPVIPSRKIADIFDLLRFSKSSWGLHYAGLHYCTSYCTVPVPVLGSCTYSTPVYCTVLVQELVPVPSTVPTICTNTAKKMPEFLLFRVGRFYEYSSTIYFLF